MFHANRTSVESFGIYMLQNNMESQFHANPREYGSIPSNSSDLIAWDYIKSPTLEP